MKRSLLFAVPALLLFSEALLLADGAVLPGNGFAASHYQPLWTKSPFAVASPEMVESSPDYLLVGIARSDGVSYASIVDKPTQQQHFLLSTEKPVNGLTLVSITQGHGSSGGSAVIQKGGESIVLKLEQPSSVPVPNMANGGPPGMPGQAPYIPGQPPYMPMPMATNMAPIPQPLRQGVPSMPPPRFRRPPIHVPPPPTPQNQGLPPQTNQAPQ